jgi:potassium efflux system protein
MINIPYKSDFRKARDLIIEELKKNEKIMLDPAPSVTVDSFSENSINYEVKFWIADLSDVSYLRNELMMDIIESFTKNEIQIL